LEALLKSQPPPPDLPKELLGKYEEMVKSLSQKDIPAANSSGQPGKDTPAANSSSKA